MFHEYLNSYCPRNQIIYWQKRKSFVKPPGKMTRILGKPGQSSGLPLSGVLCQESFEVPRTTWTFQDNALFLENKQQRILIIKSKIANLKFNNIKKIYLKKYFYELKKLVFPLKNIFYLRSDYSQGKHSRRNACLSMHTIFPRLTVAHWTVCLHCSVMVPHSILKQGVPGSILLSGMFFFSGR